MLNMIRIDKSQINMLCLQILGKGEPVMHGGLAAYDDLLSGRDCLIVSQIVREALKAFLTVAETKHFL